MFDRAAQRETVKEALDSFRNASPRDAARDLLSALGYSGEKTIRLDGSVSQFLSMVDREGKLSANERAHIHRWEGADFVFQLTNDELPMLAQGQEDVFHGERDYHRSIIESFVFLAICLEDREWSRTDLAEITRAVNRLFPMPAIIIFRYGGKLTLSVIPRRPNKKDSSRDVIEPTTKVALIKDVDLVNPHRAHLDILTDLHIQSGVSTRKAPNNFDDLYKAWTEILSTEELNKRFYRRLSDWYLWAVGTKDRPQIMFPVARQAQNTLNKDERHKLNQISVIRLLTRLIFVWFIREKGLIPDELFNSVDLKSLLKRDPENIRDESSYYKAVLQNLFFATLNTQMVADKRTWRSDKTETGATPDYLISNLYRYKDEYQDPDQALEMFRKVPFLNGGLFECLDRDVSAPEIRRNPDLENWISVEGSHNVIRADGFSERESNPLHVPNKVFFAVAEHGDEVDEPLNEAYGTKKTGQKVDGLIRIFESYKFTVEENTPFDEEVALDPELLGRVFENLIASYNEDTSTTARKKSGSFYTPRVVVDYMVDEALVGYLKPALEQPKQHVEHVDVGLHRHNSVNETPDPGSASDALDPPGNNGADKYTEPEPEQVETRLRSLLSYSDTEIQFSEQEKDLLIARIESTRAIDPACGSGAFLMGLLHKLIHVLGRLDKGNVRWKEALRKPVLNQLSEAKGSPDVGTKADRITELEEQLEKLERDFSETSNFPDYARKLYVIDKCIHGIDIQPIAVQIARLRFFISLIVSQKIDERAENLNITPLPNLETRLVAANALRPIEHDQRDLLRNPEIDLTEKALVDANERYFGARNRRTKKRAKDQINHLRETLSVLLTQSHGLPEETARQIARWDPFDQNASADFFDREWMYGLKPGERFNIVIANPPYVRQEKIGRDKEYFKQRANENRKAKNYDRPYQSFTGTADYFVYFMERGLDLLEPGGSFIFITSNKWYRAAYGKNIRRWIGRNAVIRSIIDFGDADVFDAIAYPTIIVATKRPQMVAAPDERDVLLAWNWPADMGRKDIPEFPELFRGHAFQVPQKALDDAKGWQLEPQVKRDMLQRIRNMGKPLGEYVEGRIYYGIKTGLNDAFVIDGQTKDRLIVEDPKSAEIIKPFLRGKDVKRWRVDFADQWLIKIPSSDNFKHPWTELSDDKAERVFAQTWPAVHTFMSQYRQQLIKRHDQGKYFWELRSCAYWEEFEKPKIVFPDIALSPQFSWTKEPYMLANTSYVIPIETRHEIGILNSNVIRYYYENTSPKIQNGYYRYIAQYVNTIPVPDRLSKDQKIVVGVCADLLMTGLSDPRFEQLLNGLVYELFFPDDLYARGIRLFDACDRAGLGDLCGLEGDALKSKAETLASQIFAPSQEIYRMLFDFRAIDIVRIIEGEE